MNVSSRMYLWKSHLDVDIIVFTRATFAPKLFDYSKQLRYKDIDNWEV